MSDYKYLNSVNFPSDIKKLSRDQLKILSKYWLTLQKKENMKIIFNSIIF